MTITEGYLEHPVFHLVSETARELGVRAFVIGGYVRDCFLGRANKDIDIVVEVPGQAGHDGRASGRDGEVRPGILLAEAIGKKCHARVSVFKNFGTAMLRYHGIEVEFVGARKESYHRDSRKPIVEDGTLEEDQLRRDFTINAMAFSLQAEDYGALVDPFGGIKDLAAGIIRTPLEPEQTYSDDPLRMLRAIRFAARLSTDERQFTIVPESLEAMRTMADRLQILSKERIVEELNKMLLTDHPAMAFELMEQTGLLQQFLPELSRLKGVETVDGKGHKENFTHTLQVVENVIRFEKEAIAEGRLKRLRPGRQRNAPHGAVPVASLGGAAARYWQAHQQTLRGGAGLDLPRARGHRRAPGAQNLREAAHAAEREDEIRAKACESAP